MTNMPEVIRCELRRIAITATLVMLVGCSSTADQLAGTGYLGEKKRGMDCAHTDQERVNRPNEDFNCFLPIEGPDSTPYQTADLRRAFVETRFFSSTCKAVEVISDEPAKESVYWSAGQSRLQRVGAKCIHR